MIKNPRLDILEVFKVTAPLGRVIDWELNLDTTSSHIRNNNMMDKDQYVVTFANNRAFKVTENKKVTKVTSNKEIPNFSE